MNITVEYFLETFAPIWREKFSIEAARDYEFFTEDMFLTSDEMKTALQRPFACEHGKTEVHTCMVCGPKQLLIAQIQKILAIKTGQPLGEEDADRFVDETWERHATKL